jgi:hypothetical protein
MTRIRVSYAPPEAGKVIYDMQQQRKALVAALGAFLRCGVGSNGDRFWEDYDAACQQAHDLLQEQKR